ncbi:MAG: hypothetical protein ACREFU_13990 [Acetobacteraceae bacterium]
MRRGLSNLTIQTVCRELLAGSRKVTTRQLAEKLRQRHGHPGRQERIVRALREAMQEPLPSLALAPTGDLGDKDVAALRERLKAMERRAELAEERELRHQDLWANRYVEKIAEMEAAFERKHAEQQAALAKPRPVITAEEYLRLHQRIAELTRRLAEYEDAAAGEGRARDTP